VKIESSDGLSVGELVRFSKETKPWQSGVLRHRNIAIKAGSFGRIRKKPFRMGRRGWVAYVSVSRNDLAWRISRPEPPYDYDTRDLLCSVSEIEVVGEE
jgi:hypothetical protein